jgi:hypothetical protein
MHIAKVNRCISTVTHNLAGRKEFTGSFKFTTLGFMVLSYRRSKKRKIFKF